MSGFEFSAEAIFALLNIIAIDIVLSGDNAVVIAMATRALPKHQRNKAILIGTGGAVLLRIIFAIIIVYLLQVPLVHLIGGLLLIYIAVNLLVDDEEDTEIKSSGTILKAVGTIIMADAVMSLDNVVAIAGAANGHIGMIAIGVAVSIPIMIFGSKLIVRLMDKHAWIAYIGAGILAWTAGSMIVEDRFVLDWLNLHQGLVTYLCTALITAAVLLTGFFKNRTA
ncbi:TerC family protein [Virgibacillus siamensis]|uniref:TerC family protein n=1 Tax=Virgibacillus siamensis TaxID=480071 RepID=UPI00098514F4|nr:TerC family protein [Virgibacillus siamensis]